MKILSFDDILIKTFV